MAEKWAWSTCELKYFGHDLTLECIGGSRIFQKEGAYPKGTDASLLFDEKFPDNCMKMKEFGPGGGEGPFRHLPLDFRLEMAENYNLDSILKR